MHIKVDDMFSPDAECRALARNAVIFLDGVEVKGCTEANEEKGYIERQLSADDPRVMAHSGWEWPSERLYGQVYIKARD